MSLLFLKGNTMFTIHKIVKMPRFDGDGAIGWAVIFDKAELIAEFKYIDDANAFASFKETEYEDAEEALRALGCL